MRKLPLILSMSVLGFVGYYTLFGPLSPQLAAISQANGPAPDENVDVKLARVHVQLAKLEVERALEANQRNANSYSAEHIELLRLHLLIDEAALEQSLRGEQADSHEVCIRNAEASLKIAQSVFKSVQSVHERMPTFGMKFDVEEARLKVELAELELQQMRQLDSHDTRSVLLHLQRQVDRLKHQVLKIQLRP